PGRRDRRDATRDDDRHRGGPLAGVSGNDPRGVRPGTSGIGWPGALGRVLASSSRAKEARREAEVRSQASPCGHFPLTGQKKTKEECLIHPTWKGWVLALKTFFKTDYRGVVKLLEDFAELRQVLGLSE